MGNNKFELRAVDRKGKSIKIKCEGIDDNELAHFGGLDLHVKAVKTLIRNTNGLSFPEKEGDFSISDKVIALYLNEIGELIRNLAIEPGYVNGLSNMELVKKFLEAWEEDDAVVKIVEKDNDLIREDNKRLIEEEDSTWDSIMLDY